MLRIWVGLYWIWNGIDDRRRREDIAALLARSRSSSRFSWYRDSISSFIEAHAYTVSSLLPFTTFLAGLLIGLGVLVEVAVAYLILYCLNLYAMGSLSMKGLWVHLAPLLIVGLSSSGPFLSIPWLLSLTVIQYGLGEP